MKANKIVASLFAAGVMSSPLAYATNGMNLEGYGPVAAAMGGASMAYDNGTAAVMNNPATLGLMSDGSRLDIAVGVLAPSITTTAGGKSSDSTANAFYMPAVGYAKKSGQMTYGVGVFSQGGMGTEYEPNGIMDAGSGKKVRSEVGVGRLIVPLAYNVDDKITIAGSLDYVWAGMDVMMAMSGPGFLDMTANGTQTAGTVSGDMINTMGMMMTPGAIPQCGPAACISSVQWARLDFSDSSNFSGKAKGTGFAGKLGGTFKVSNELTLGMTYHSKTSISDLKASGASMSFNATGIALDPLGLGTLTTATVPVTGSVKVKNFQWPQTFAFGGAYQASEKLLVVADYKNIGWKDAMKSFNVTFTADGSAANGSFANQSVDMVLFQNWEDQNVFEVGGAYKTSEELTLRAGLNLANNPVPDKYMNPLFPAIATNHLTLGAGYVLSKVSSLDFSYVYVPKVSATNPNSTAAVDFGGYSAQLMYSYKM